MSDPEEPPKKLHKTDNGDSVMVEGESAEEPQEEWLSEGILTDEDNQAPRTNTEEDTTMSVDSQSITQELKAAVENSVPAENNEFKKEDITEPLKTEPLESEPLKTEPLETEPLKSEPLETEPLKSEHLKTEQTEIDTNLENVVEATEMTGELSADDGNDTDDLLRMLEDDDKSKDKKKKGKKHAEGKKAVAEDVSTDDDIDEYELINRTKAAKLAREEIARRNVKVRASKAIEEDTSDAEETDESMDVVDIIKKMFPTRQRMVASKSTSKNSNPLRKSVTKKPLNAKDKLAPTKESEKTKDSSKEQKEKEESSDEDDLINEEEFLEDDDFDLDEDFTEQVTLKRRGSTENRGVGIMKPEEMDEELPSDYDSFTDEDSLYDGLPSSESDAEEEFILDVRNEIASSYIPLLGDKAREHLLEERDRSMLLLKEARMALAGSTSAVRARAHTARSADAALARLRAGA